MSDNQNEKLLQEFPPVSTEAWEEVIRQDLKGADYEKKLCWNTYEGFQVKPYYRSSDLANLQYLESSAPGQFPFVRGREEEKNAWSIRQEIMDASPAAANETARRSLERGAESVCFVIQPADGGIRGVSVQSLADMRTLLAGLDLAATPVHFRAGAYALPVLALFLEALPALGIDPKTVRGSIDFDPIADLLSSGKSAQAKDALLAETVEALRAAAAVVPQFKTLAIRAELYLEAGGSAVEELGFAIATGVEYLSAASAAGIPVTEAAGRMQFNFAAGTNYFMEIAKLRAARLLWARVQEAFAGAGEAVPMTLNVRTASFDKTVFDPYVNLLRGTTEAMSAAIGGCDSLAVAPFDEAYRAPDEFSHHLARNTQLILKHESYFEKSVDSAAGSYYIESLTDSLAQHAWALLQKVEGEGGMLAAVEAGFVQKSIAAIAGKRRAAIAARRDIILGTNQYPNIKEQMAPQVAPDANFTPLNSTGKTVAAGLDAMRQAAAQGATLGDFAAVRSAAALQAEALRPFRAADEFESIRLKTEAFAERTGRRPVVFLLTMGDLKMRQARAGFVAGFFGCAGFDVVDNFGFKTAEDAIAAAVAKSSEVVVLCSSDDEYPGIAESVIPGLKKALPNCAVVVAGMPKDTVEKLKELGVDDFVHVRSNAIDTLKAYQSRLGM